MPEWKRYRSVLLAGWVLLALAAAVYARVRSVPVSVAAPLAAAFLLEFAFYLLPAFPKVWAECSARLGRLGTVGFLGISSALPYVVYTLPAGIFHARDLLLLAAIATVTALVYTRGRVNAPRDVLFLAMLAAFILYRFFDRIYPPPLPKLQVSILGHVMLIRTAALSLLALRGGVAARFAFLPSKDEWIAGVKWFILSVIPVAAVGWLTGAIRVRDHALNPATGIATFVGILWVVALSEEYFFRGLMQDWMEAWFGNRWAALGVASTLFGSVHLGFHGAFPNWRFSLVAAVLGVFCGLAWREKRSIQTSMVTHALAATIFRVFFQ